MTKAMWLGLGPRGIRGGKGLGWAMILPVTVRPEPIKDAHVLFDVTQVRVRAEVAVAQLKERRARQQRVRTRLHTHQHKPRQFACASGQPALGLSVPCKPPGGLTLFADGEAGRCDATVRF